MSACLSIEMDMQGETSHLFYFDGSLFSILSVLGCYLLHRRASFERGGDVCQLCTSTFISINLILCWDISVRILAMAFRRYGKQQPKFYSVVSFFLSRSLLLDCRQPCISSIYRHWLSLISKSLNQKYCICKSNGICFRTLSPRQWICSVRLTINRNGRIRSTGAAANDDNPNRPSASSSCCCCFCCVYGWRFSYELLYWLSEW